MDIDSGDRGALELDKKPLMMFSKLRIKLKVMERELDVHGGKEQKEDDQGRLDWICKLCGKEFGSVKALGGHMRVHQEQTAGVAGRKPYLVEDRKPTCSLCGKTFPSSKSLFGHMRCHPEREWRGMHPPETSKPATNSGAPMLPSPSVDDQLVDYHRIDCVDLLRGLPLPGWSVKAKRSSISAAVIEDQMVKGAVYGLMLMATGNDCCLNLGDADEIGDDDKLRFVHHGSTFDQQDYLDSADKIKLLLEAGVDLEKENSLDASTELNRTDPSSVKGNTLGKKRKRQTGKEQSNQKISNPDAAASDSKCYRCSICDKAFASHQALGGHKSSAHFKILSKNTAHHEPELVEHGGVGEVSTHELDHQQGIQPIASQLPHPPPAPATPTNASEAGTSTSDICKICDKEFPSGQALGGHMRRHWSGPPSSLLAGNVELVMMSSGGHDHSGSSSSPAAASDHAMQVLKFDLNQLPGDDPNV